MILLAKRTSLGGSVWAPYDDEVAIEEEQFMIRK
jgi:hypothetical protein